MNINWEHLVSAVIGAIVGAGITLTINVVRKNKSSNNNKVKIGEAKVGGDFAGRDINKK